MAIKAHETDEQGTITPARRRELLDELQGYIAKAQEGDEEALSKIRQVLKEAPRLAQIFMDLADVFESSLVKRVAGNDPLTQEVISPQLEIMRKELAGPNVSPLERLLAERIVACWLQLQYADAIYAEKMDNLTMAQSEYHQRKLDRLHRRYLSSIKALAQIRKLGPAVQINIADKQVNTAG